MKNKILLPIILFATLALSACTGVNQAGQQSSNDQSPTSESTNPSSETSESESPSESETSSETIQYGVAITNKAALQAEWHVRESSRDIDINLTPAGNVALEIAKKNLRITSSNSEVVLANGVALTPVGEGTATITVDYHGEVDTVELTVLAEKGEPDHVQATIAQILQNLEDGKEKDVIYEIEAYVVAWQSGKADATKYGNYMLADSMDSEQSILVYGSSANAEAFKIEWTGEAYTYTQGDDAKDFLTNDVTKDVGIGSKLTMQVIAYKYSGTTPELSGLVLEADNSGVEHHDFPEPAVVNATMAEVWANEQGNGAVKFHVTNVKLFSFADNKGAAVGTAGQYGNALLGDEGEYYAYGLTATASALAWSTDAGMYTFTNPKDFTSNETTKDLKAGAVVDLDLIRCDYNTTKEVCGVITNVVSNDGDEGGGGEGTPEPAVVNATMAEVWANEQGNGAVKFHVTNVKLFAFATNKGVATESASKYGNALLGEEGEYFAYGLSAAASALAWDSTSGKYLFTNAQDFLTAELTKDLKAGAVVDLDLIRCDYNTTKEVCGVITNVVSNGEGGGEGTPEPAVVNATMAEVWANEAGNGKVKFHVENVKLHAFATNKGVATESASKYGNALLGEEGEYFAYGLSAASSALAWDSVGAVYQFTNAQDFLTADLTKDLKAGAVVDLDLIRCDYNTTKEVCGVITNVVSNGSEPEETPEPAVVNATMAEVWANEAGNGKVKFHVENVKLHAFATNKGVATESASQYGNALLGDEGQYFAYGLSVASTAMTWDGAAAVYKFNNAKDFLTADLTKDIKAGALVDLDLIRCDYNTTKEVCGIVTAVHEAEPAAEALPVLASGNSATRVEGAGAMIYLDNTVLGITGANAGDVQIDVELTVAMSDQTPEESKDAAQHYITGADAAVVLGGVKQFDDYGEGTVRLYITMDKGLNASWKMQHTFNITLTVDGTVYQGAVVFVGNAYQAA